MSYLPANSSKSFAICFSKTRHKYSYHEHSQRMQRSVEQLHDFWMCFSSVVCAFILFYSLTHFSRLVRLVFSFVKYYLNCSLNCNLRTNAINIQTKGEKFWNSYSTWKLAYTSYYNIQRTFFANALREETSFDFC